MARLWHDALRRPAGDLPFLALCVATALSMFRAVDEPGFSVHVGGTDVSVVPTDIALAVLGVFCIARLLGRRRLPQPARSISAAALAFCAWLLISSALNGFTTLVGAVKLLEYAILGLGAVLFLQRRSTFWSFVALLVALAALADLYALKGFVQHPGVRQDSFTGAHDLAALASISLVLALAALFARQHRLGKLPLIAGIVGTVGVILGAALASLLGVYLAAAAVVGLAAGRRMLTLRALLATGAILAVVTGGSLSLRSNDLGFLNAWFGSTQEAKPGQYAASWSQRLIYVYIGGRVFAANPVLGTGWYGELPPKEWARFLPDAKRRFPDQPPRYFPKPDQSLIPQQTYDQVLFELGLVGGVLFLTLGVLTVRTAGRVGLRWPHDGAHEVAAFLPVGWTASLIGAIAGAALFGGIPITALFWLTIGLVALSPSLMPPEPVAEREPAPAVAAPA
jgi:O-Antigen ligase